MRDHHTAYDHYVTARYHNRLRFPQLTRHIWMLVKLPVLLTVFLIDTGDRNSH